MVVFFEEHGNNWRRWADILIELVRSHLARRAVRFEQRAIFCLHCGHPLSMIDVRVRVSAGKDFIFCHKCDKKVKLYESEAQVPTVQLIEQTASDLRDRQIQRYSRKIGRQATNDYEAILIHHPENHEEVAEMIRDLRDAEDVVAGQQDWNDTDWQTTLASTVERTGCRVVVAQGKRGVGAATRGSLAGLLVIRVALKSRKTVQIEWGDLSSGPLIDFIHAPDPISELANEIRRRPI